MAKKTVKPKSAPSSSTPRSKIGPPAPYSIPPPALEQFLSALNPKHVYITHIDRHPAAFKRRLFTVPIAMNLAIIALLAYRAYYIFPFYMYLLMTAWGYETPYFVNAEQMQWNELTNETFYRMAPMVVDVSLVTFILPWPWNFFFGYPSNPSSWRNYVGFNDSEIAIRKSRSWDQELPKNWLAEEEDGAVYRERIMPAIDKKLVKEKSSYLMMDKSWDLDFEAMINAHKLVDQNQNTLADFEKQVIVHHPDFGWLVWQVWKLDEGAEEEGRQKIVQFKDKLTAMGKENLFFRWIEIVQYESTQPGGFTPERQAKAMEEARKLFEGQGVDFDKFWEEVGGMESMPGMEKEESEN